MCDDIVIVPHHPDRLRRPAVKPGAHDEERCIQALTWNVFRTLELLPPAFWLRRLHAYLRGEASGAAAQTVSVSLWRELALPPAQRVDGARPGVVVDVLIETEHAVWGLMTATTNDMRWSASEPDQADAVSRMMAAVAWVAGTRDCHVGLIPSTFGGMLPETAALRRYSRSRESVSLRAGSGSRPLTNIRGVGLVRWTQLASILGDCAQAPVLAEVERSLALHALTWLERAGVQPTHQLSLYRHRHFA